MDAARAAMGHGWPFAAGLWNGDGVSEPRRSRGRMIGRRVLVTFARKSDSPDRAKREMSANRRKRLSAKTTRGLTRPCLSDVRIGFPETPQKTK